MRVKDLKKLIEKGEEVILTIPTNVGWKKDKRVYKDE